jgi:hypothetical protein
VLGIDLENTESFVRSSCMYAVCEVRDVLFHESAKSHFELYIRRVPDLSAFLLLLLLPSYDCKQMLNVVVYLCCSVLLLF